MVGFCVQRLQVEQGVTRWTCEGSWLVESTFVTPFADCTAAGYAVALVVGTTPKVGVTPRNAQGLRSKRGLLLAQPRLRAYVVRQRPQGIRGLREGKRTHTHMGGSVAVHG